MKLSILICSLKEREKSFLGLLESLSSQIEDDFKVEVLHEIDNREMDIGTKRNKLLDRATGEYLCFIDDDDEISENYVVNIIEAIKNNPDCVAFKLKYYEDGVFKGIAHHSIKYDSWRNKQLEYGEMFYERTPNHLNPIKSEIAKRVKFPECNFGEDHAWSNSIYQYLKTESEIEEPVYFYKYQTGVK